MPFKSTIRIPSEVLEVIVSLTELTSRFSLDAAGASDRQVPEAPAERDTPLAMSGVRWGGAAVS